MEIKIMQPRRLTVPTGACLVFAGMALAAGCGNKAEETATTAPPAATSANVPPSAAQEAQARQQGGGAPTRDPAADAAAFRAAREKAEGR